MVSEPLVPLEADRVWAGISHEPPLADLMKDWHRDRWVRFYSLPKGKRYADTDAEWEELLRRADTIIGEACSTDDQLMLVTGLHGEPGSEPSRDDVTKSVQPNAAYWREIAWHGNEDDWPCHLWVSWPTYTPRCFDPSSAR